MSDPKVIVALDFSDKKRLEQLVERLEPAQCRLKVGKELFTRLGPDVVSSLSKKGFDVFLDLKYHDIPNTVAQACRAAADLGVWMLNVHALGGKRMLAAAAETISNFSRPPLLIAVTILTSMQENELPQIGIESRADEMVDRLALLAQQTGLDGVVCSALEAQRLREKCGEKFLLVTPGIRLAGDDQDDQRRVMTPLNALHAGADYLVIGRPIAAAIDPIAKLKLINSEIASLA